MIIQLCTLLGLRPLHSNLVIFKSHMDITGKSPTVFTFQSGYIQINKGVDNTVTDTALHSNLVIFKYHVPSFSTHPFLTLHSNLVIFKWYRNVNANFVEFTLHSNLVIFKCGRRHSTLILCFLYIPIWLYSNGFPFRNIQPTLYFTFQSGYIQIVYRLLLYWFVHSLHSNLVIFKWFS